MLKNTTKSLEEYSNKELCRFITCGSVDDGKSTLIGRILYDLQEVFEDQLNALKKESKKYGTQSGEIDFALLVDGLSSEREQGITIDVAYRYFSTKKRKFIIADTPGHEQYTRNMVVGASNADIAVILVDARNGILKQTNRHSYIAALLGVKQFIVAINKMDLVNFNEEIFNNICNEYSKIVSFLPNYDSITINFIPLSALKGDNILNKSQNMLWYRGKTLLELLDSLPIIEQEKDEFILPVQYVNRPHLDYRAFCGGIISGKVKIGDEVVALPSMQKNYVKSIIDTRNIDVNHNKHTNVGESCVSSAVSLILQDEMDVSRGDVIASVKNTLCISDVFRAMVVWMSEKDLILEGNYLIKIATSYANCWIESVDFQKDINNLKEISGDTLKLNDIGGCKIRVNRRLVLQKYKENKELGSFMIVDKYTNETIAIGLIFEILEEIKQREYTETERGLNAYIRENFPEWECKKI